MQNIESLKASLCRAGWCPSLLGTKDGWACSLSNTSYRTMAQGRGATALEAMRDADEDRKRIEKEPKYKM